MRVKCPVLRIREGRHWNGSLGRGVAAEVESPGQVRSTSEIQHSWYVAPRTLQSG